LQLFLPSFGLCINTVAEKAMFIEPGENIYRNLALQVGGVSKIETIKYARESHGTQI
jgi:hypothetical protein